jgi:hypothetical protein
LIDKGAFPRFPPPPHRQSPRIHKLEPRQTIDYLVDIGQPAIDPLKRVIDDKEFIGRQPARDALTRIAATIKARELLDRRDDLKSLSSGATGHDRLPASVLSAAFDPDLMRVHGQYVALDNGADDGMVALQSFDDSKGIVVLEIFVVRGGMLYPLRIVSSGELPPKLPDASVLFEIASERGVIRLSRLQERKLEVEVDGGAVSQPQPGLRVRLQGYDAQGALVREDKELWIVKLDQPIDGMSELPVAASALVGLRKVQRIETSVETMIGKVRIDAIELTTREIFKEPDAFIGIPTQCQQYKILMERIQHCNRLSASERRDIQVAFERMLNTWKDTRPEDRDALAVRCKAGADSVRQVASPFCGL